MNATEAITYLKEKVDPDEPVFVLRSQDALAPQTVRAWAADLAMRCQGTNPKAVSALLVSQEMMDWQSNHVNRVKVPD